MLILLVKSLMAVLLGCAFKGHEINCHDQEVMVLNPGRVEPVVQVLLSIIRGHIGLHYMQNVTNKNQNKDVACSPSWSYDYQPTKTFYL